MALWAGRSPATARTRAEDGEDCRNERLSLSGGKRTGDLGWNGRTAAAGLRMPEFSSAVAPTVAGLFSCLAGGCDASPAPGTATIGWPCDGEQRLMAGFVQLEVSTGSPWEAFGVAAPDRFGEAGEIPRFPDSTLD